MGQIAEVAGLFDQRTSHDAPRQELPVTGRLGELIPTPREAGTSTRLVVDRGAHEGAEFVISAPLTVIGRHRDCDIVIDDVTVSRYHAELEIENGRFFLYDGGSLNGTYVNRRPVERIELFDADEIWIGKARFTFHVGAAADVPVPAQR
ncbi:FHA domain-containing protein [Saccharopolyspora karakumensis]|uniref:FHA domain-containing protein n=1 Tax=Saccharopolyspora karakumensis TaxID=2530386 RepID=A0A4R5BR50_9PSEU|nr:FHA domain-containing protein [Saccharopolyspora karakumensis]TDD89448.1 FHA domain-containing protein [Saccharopolyspora karakumensis]